MSELKDAIHTVCEPTKNKRITFLEGTCPYCDQPIKITAEEEPLTPIRDALQESNWLDAARFIFASVRKWFE